MKKTAFTLSLSFLLFVSLFSQTRTIGFQIDMTENDNYDSAVYHAKAACAEYVHFAFDWNMADTANASYDTAGIAFLEVLDFYFPSQNMKLELNIPVINTVKREVPADLENVPFDSSLIITRFKIFLDTLFHYIPNVELIAFNIGNESDGYWDTDTAAVYRFRTFLDSVQPYAKALYYNIHGTELMCGTTLGYNGLVSSEMKNIYQQLNAPHDIVSVTYYPLGLGFQVQSPTVVPNDFAELVSLYPDTSLPIFFAECGYPSSAGCSSSYELQRQFIWNVFQAWDTYEDNIQWITFFSLTDWPAETVDTLVQYYGLPSDTGFWHYLASLGLREYPGNGTNKPAYEELRCQASFRNFCSAECVLGIQYIENNDIRIMPNPAESYLNIEIKQEEFEYEILNTQGQICLKGQNAKQINVSDLESGVYFIRIFTDKDTGQQFEFLKN
ncbi:MAG: T9SS type A sorting domain-containing protein [Bacteroidales bacterium]|nr:T9SS type A sorting domain-containing protein [Bacteroidales bacterium]